VLARHNQHMRRGRRLDVAKRNGSRILIYEIRGDLAAHNATKDTLNLLGHRPLLSPVTDTARRFGVNMPELPEVETVCRTLDGCVPGHRIEGVELFWERTLALDAENFAGTVVGATFRAVHRRAKLVVMELDSGDAITVHLRMTGELLFRAGADARNPAREPYLRARFALDRDAELLFYDVRKFGRIGLILEGQAPHALARYGVEPLQPEFTPDALSALLRSRKRQLKPLLLDQAIIAGLGNIYVDESLFVAGLHPLQRSDQIDHAHVAALHAAIVRILQTAIDLRGSTIRNYRSGLGEPGDAQATWQVYGHKPGSPCVVCGTPLVRMVIGQRGSMFCPRCQPLTLDVPTPAHA
jgi:formamidopyrimidine-DNA glycosylase